MNRVILIVSLLLSFQSWASDLELGSFEGRTTRNQTCFYNFDGQILIFGFRPYDRDWKTCEVKWENIITNQNRVSARSDDCKAVFSLNEASSLSAVMTFNKPGGPSKVIRCLDIK